MKVLVPGVAGFVGKAVLQELLAQGHDVIGIVRSSQEAGKLRSSKVLTIEADVTDPTSLVDLPAFDACIYLPGLLRENPAKGVTFQKVHMEGVRNLLSVARKLGATRWLQMSALGVGREYHTKYYDTKLEAEKLVKVSGLDWTIFRPSVVFSEEYDPRLNFVSELGNVLKKAPVMPIFGDGKYRLQPIALSVLAKAMVDSLTMTETHGKTYEIGGPDKLQYREILRTIAQAQGVHRPFVNVPFGMMKGIAGMLDRFQFFPVTRDQLTMLENENVVKDEALEQDFERTFKPRTVRFEDGVRAFYKSR